MTRFRIIQPIEKVFCDAWKRDYLTILQVRKKWFTNGPEISCGNLVLLAEDNLKPLQWKTGFFEEVYAGNDSVMRVVKVKTSAGDIIPPCPEVQKASNWTMNFMCFLVYTMNINIHRSSGVVCWELLYLSCFDLPLHVEVSLSLFAALTFHCFCFDFYFSTSILQRLKGWAWVVEIVEPAESLSFKKTS